MAVTAKFQADFSSFSDAVEKAEVQLREFEGGAGKVESALTRMSNNFSGVKIIQDATLMAAAVDKVGGVSTLTEKELAKVSATAQEAAAKLTALGQTVPQGIQKIADASKEASGRFSEMHSIVSELAGAFGIAFSAEAIIAFTKETIESTARLEDLALATGITTDGLQRMSFVAKEFGIDTEQMTRGVEQLSAKLAGGDKNATTAVEMLGLNVKTLIALGPQEAFIQIAEAAGRIDDPMTKGAIAADLFGGRLAKQLLPILGDLRQKMQEVPKDSIISDANITKAHDFEVALDHATVSLKAHVASIFGAVSSYNRWLESGTGLSGFLDMLHGKTPAVTKDTSEHQAAVEGAANATIHLTETVKDRIAAEAKEAEELKKFTEAMVEINSAGMGWRGTLDTINGSVAEAIKFYLEAGVAQDKLAAAYGLTASQIKAVASEMKDENEQLKIQAAATLEVTKLWDEFNDIASQGGTAFDKQVAAIDRWALDLEAKAQKAGTDTAAFYDALTSLWNAKLKQASDAATAALAKTSSVAIQSFDAMNTSVMGIATSFDGWNKSIMAVDASLKSVAKNRAALDAGNTIDIGTAAQDPRIMAFLKEGWSLKNAEALKLGEDWGFSPHVFDPLGNPESLPSPKERVPGYAGGVTNAPGGWSIVGEKGPERMYVPKGASILPNGSGGQSVNVVINLSALTPGDARVREQLRATVESVVVDSLKSRVSLT